MSTSPDSSWGQSGNDLRYGRAEERLTWFALASTMLRAALGGVWPEQPASLECRWVLDVGCGSGDWLLSAARMYPAIQKLHGVDASRRLIVRARALAREQKLDDRLEFHVMDALRMLEFPFDYVDLVNIQLGGRFLRTWEWSKLLHECRRVTRLGGIIRAVEQDYLGETNSPALNRLLGLFLRAHYQSGHLFAPEPAGLLDEMPRLFDQFGVREIQMHQHIQELRGDMPEWQPFARSLLLAITPFVAKWSRLPEDYEELCQQVLEEIARPDFVAQWKLLVIWGLK